MTTMHTFAAYDITSEWPDNWQTWPLGDDGRPQEPPCGECDGTGWRDVKSPDDAPGYDYCTCTLGQIKRQQARDRAQRERAAEDAANLPW